MFQFSNYQLFGNVIFIIELDDLRFLLSCLVMVLLPLLNGATPASQWCYSLFSSAVFRKIASILLSFQLDAGLPVVVTSAALLGLANHVCSVPMEVQLSPTKSPAQLLYAPFNCYFKS